MGVGMEGWPLRCPPGPGAWRGCSPASSVLWKLSAWELQGRDGSCLQKSKTSQMDVCWDAGPIGPTCSEGAGSRVLGSGWGLGWQGNYAPSLFHPQASLQRAQLPVASVRTSNSKVGAIGRNFILRLRVACPAVDTVLWEDHCCLTAIL